MSTTGALLLLFCAEPLGGANESAGVHFLFLFPLTATVEDYISKLSFLKLDFPSEQEVLNKRTTPELKGEKGNSLFQTEWYNRKDWRSEGRTTRISHRLDTLLLPWLQVNTAVMLLIKATYSRKPHISIPEKLSC